MSEEFYSVANFQLCIDRFRKYLISQGIPEPGDLSQRLYRQMVEFRDTETITNVRDANNAVLNGLRSAIQDPLSVPETPQPPVTMTPPPLPPKRPVSRPLPKSLPKKLDVDCAADGAGGEYCSVVATPPSTERVAPISEPRVDSVRHYLSLTGADRDWVAQRHRYRYALDVGARFRNVGTLAATCIILPMEISEKRTLSMVPKSTFLHEYGLMYPYLLLCVENAASVYTGANAAVRRAFAKFVYETSYRSPNGRGYLIMRPMQNESMVFRPAPLASLDRISLEIQKPNGTLYNDAVDDFGVIKIEHEAWNRMFLKVITDKYFDRNEFYIGDSIILAGFDLGSSKALERLAAFMNRREGHEIAEIGKANAQGFHNNFYIPAPAQLDSEVGRMELDVEVIESLVAYNRSKRIDDVACHIGDGDSSEVGESSSERGCEPCCTEDSSGPFPPAQKPECIGKVINASLQNTVSFTVTTLESDVSCLNVSLVSM